MAVSNSIGSNVFDILIGLGLPWALQTLAVDYGSYVSWFCLWFLFKSWALGTLFSGQRWCGNTNCWEINSSSLKTFQNQACGEIQALKTGLANLFCEGPDSNTLGFVGQMVSVTTIHLCCPSCRQCVNERVWLFQCNFLYRNWNLNSLWFLHVTICDIGFFSFFLTIAK